MTSLTDRCTAALEKAAAPATTFSRPVAATMKRAGISIGMDRETVDMKLSAAAVPNDERIACKLSMQRAGWLPRIEAAGGRTESPGAWSSPEGETGQAGRGGQMPPVGMRLSPALLKLLALAKIAPPEQPASLDLAVVDAACAAAQLSVSDRLALKAGLAGLGLLA